MKNGVFRFLFLFLVAATAVLSCIPASAGDVPWRYVRKNGREYVSLGQVASRFRLQPLVSGRNVELRGNHHRFVFTPEKTAMMFNGVNISLNHAVMILNDVPYISRSDFETTVLVMLSRDALPNHTIKKIALDPGHGGRDRGAMGRSFKESSLNLLLARRLKKKLEDAGYSVIMTRNSDVAVDLARRPEIADARGADIFVSLHMNASVNRNVSGIETYCLTPEGAASSSGGKIDNSNYRGNANDCNNMALAYLIQRSMIAATGADDLGVKHARFMVLKQSRVPSVLVECGFISNYYEERQLGSEAYQEQMAEAIARGIKNYHKAVSR